MIVAEWSDAVTSWLQFIPEYVFYPRISVYIVQEHYRTYGERPSFRAGRLNRGSGRQPPPVSHPREERRSVPLPDARARPRPNPSPFDPKLARKTSFAQAQAPVIWRNEPKEAGRFGQTNPKGDPPLIPLSEQPQRRRPAASGTPHRVRQPRQPYGYSSAADRRDKRLGIQIAAPTSSPGPSASPFRCAPGPVHTPPQTRQSPGPKGRDGAPMQQRNLAPKCNHARRKLRQATQQSATLRRHGMPSVRTDPLADRQRPSGVVRPAQRSLTWSKCTFGL
jgi:hypothetical protein